MPQRTSSKPRLNSSIKASGRRAKADLEKRARRARSVSSRGRSKIDLLQQEGDRNQRGGEKRQSRKDVDIGKVGRLGRQAPPDPGDRLMARILGARPLSGEEGRGLHEGMIIGER